MRILAADPRSLAFAKCFVREENDFEGCISSDNEEDKSSPSKIQNVGFDDGQTEILSEHSENSDTENKESFKRPKTVLY
jgi:hypothetical protein